MATKKAVKGKGKTVRKSPGKAAIDKSFVLALKNVEDMAREQISSASDPFKVGIKIVDAIKKMTTRLENEIEYDSRDLTEAFGSDPGVVGVGIGVF